MIDERVFPSALVDVSRVRFPYSSEEDVDFEPFAEFVPREETLAWFRRWTGNPELEGPEFLVFGRDGTGGKAAFWVCRQGAPVASQPVVFLGSEGECGLVATELDEFLWLLADGSGPYEAIDDPARVSRPREQLVEIAQQCSAAPRMTAAEVVERANLQFPHFTALIEELTR